MQRYIAMAWTVPFLVTGISAAQSFDHHDDWLMKNYRFTGPPPANQLIPSDPLISELRKIQGVVLSILRKTDFARDYEAALAAAAQATANAQMIQALKEASHPSQPAREIALNGSKSDSPIYLIALKDQTIHLASSYWVDRYMLHYMTPQGAHVQVRRDLVDQSLSMELNHQKGLEFRLPE